jgi:hypothetical protein
VAGLRVPIVVDVRVFVKLNWVEKIAFVVDAAGSSSSSSAKKEQVFFILRNSGLLAIGHDKQEVNTLFSKDCAKK